MESEKELLPREIIKKISDAALELAFTRHELTTTEYEDQEYADVEEGVEAFKELVEEVKADVFACLTGDEEGCLDPEDVDYDNELQWLIRKLGTPAALNAAPAQCLMADCEEPQAHFCVTHVLESLRLIVPASNAAPARNRLSVVECPTCSMGIHRDCVTRATFDLAVQNAETRPSITEEIIDEGPL